MTEGAELVPLADSPDRGAIQLMFDLEQSGELSFKATMLEIRNVELSRENWQSIGVFLGTLDRASRWWVGDWINSGEELYGEDAFQSMEATTADRYNVAERVTGLDPGTLMNIRSICGRVLPEQRRVELGFWIHGEVAALDPDDQASWLQRAVDENWTRAQLRDAIREAKSPGTPPPPDPPPGEGEPPPLSRTERLEHAARVIYQTWQPTSDGSFLVTPEAAAQLVEALGEE